MIRSLILAKSRGIFYPQVLAKDYLKGKKITVKNVVKKLAQVDDALNVNVSAGFLGSVAKKTEKLHKKVENTKISTETAIKNSLQFNLAYSILEVVLQENKNKMAVWIPSESENPSLEHMANYGKIFNLQDGVDGDLPGKRPNCRCGIKIID